MESKFKNLMVAAGLITGLGALIAPNFNEQSAEQSLAAQSFQPVLPLPANRLSLPFMADVVRGLQEHGQDKVVQALTRLDQGTQQKRAEAASTVRRSLGSLDSRSQVALRLQLARAVAGLSKTGQRVGGSNAAYRGQLNSALQAAQSLGDQEKSATFGFAMSVWRMTEGTKIDWSRPPFKMTSVGDSIIPKAIIERAALADWRDRKPDVAVRKYRALAQSMTGTPVRAELDLRVLDLVRVTATGKSAPKVYESALIAAEKDYLDTSILGDGQESRIKSVQMDILKRHRALVLGEMAQASSAKAQTSDRKRAIGMGQTLIGVLQSGPEVVSIKVKMAGLYELNKQYAEAVGVYKELADASAKDAQRPYVIAAIRVQSLLADWPRVAPWSGMPNSKGGKLDARGELLELYQRLAGLLDGRNWEVASQQGLLAVSLERRDEAFTLWQDVLKTQSTGVHAVNAMGTMLTAYSSEQNWAETEKLARFTIEHRMSPVYRGKSLNSGDILALAVIEQGKVALAEQKYKEAIGRFSEVVKAHSHFARCDEALFLLGSAYHGAGQHSASVNSLLAFEQRYPRSGFYRQAVLNGGDWSSAMASEENTVFFYQRFAQRFGKDSEAQRIRDSLAALHIGMGHYSDALAVLNMTVAASDNSATKIAALTKIMEIERRSGTLARAGLAAQKILQSNEAGEDAKASALGVKANLAAAQGRFGEVESIAQQLAGMSSAAAQEALGGARYVLAMARSKAPVQAFNNLELRDPAATLQSHYAAYRVTRQAFMSVCDAGATSYCPIAMMKLSELSKAFVESAQDIEIQESLAMEVVQRFKAQRQSIMSDVSKTAQQADTKAIAAVKSGLSDPDTTQAVLWQAAGDWQSERVSGSAGNGFVQWSADEGASHD